MNTTVPQHDDLAALQVLSDSFETASPLDILRWAMQSFGARLSMATAFGAEGCVLIAMIADLRRETGITPDIFNLDTGYQFAETLDLREQMQEKYQLPIRLVSGRETVGQMEARLGGPIYGSDPAACCHARKVVPLQDALGNAQAWVTAIRRDQTPERAASSIVGPEPKYPGLIKINPLANWSKAQVWDYVRAHDVPTNPLHARGFPSIGCWPCTRAVEAGEDDRAGRWAGTARQECGLHLGADGKLERVAKVLQNAPMKF